MVYVKLSIQSSETKIIEFPLASFLTMVGDGEFQENIPSNNILLFRFFLERLSAVAEAKIVRDRTIEKHS